MDVKLTKYRQKICCSRDISLFPDFFNWLNNENYTSKTITAIQMSNQKKKTHHSVCDALAWINIT